MTPDSTAFDPKGLFSAREIAGSIAGNIDGQGTDGTVMQYLPNSGEWQVLSGDGALGKPLVLVADWSQDSTADKLNSGFSEAAADALFAALVGLNQSYGQTDDSQNQKDALFNSPMHFIGFGRGAVVNSEIIQRLGTFFPKDTHPGMFPDLQMTTVDPHDFPQELGSQTLNYFDPQVQVWENVTFADNYYQTATTSTPKGRALVNAESSADLQVHLGGVDESNNPIPESRVGFTLEDVGNNKNPHARTVAWYGGTVDLSWSKDNPLGTPIHRRKGDFSYGELFDPNFPDAFPWYEAYNTGSSSAPPIPVPITVGSTLQTEGVGNGWYYSVLGGGSNKRQDERGLRAPVNFDNTYTDLTIPTIGTRMRGDYAIPTLFNGNFDAIIDPNPAQPIPGWSFHNGAKNDSLLTQTFLMDWHDINNRKLTQEREIKNYGKGIANRSSYVEQLGILPGSNYALKLEAGQQIIHNRFIVPESGALRFNLHVPKSELGTDRQVIVSLKGENDTDYRPIGSVLLSSAKNENSSTKDSYNEDRFRIGFGTEAFETFNIDDADSSVLRDMRGKPALLKFELLGGGTVYLDDVFFKSVHLKFGSPTFRGEEARRDPSNIDNHLVEKPQYTVSYDNNSRNPLWVSRQLNRTWLGTVARESINWKSDTTLPSSFSPLVENKDYTNIGTLVRGHMTASAERNRHEKDQLATFIFTNALPQESGNNAVKSAWESLEQFTYEEVALRGKELYITSGGIGTKGTISSKNINIPRFTWKNILTLDRPGLSVQDILRGEGNPVFISVITSNEPEPTDFSIPIPHPLNELFPGRFAPIESLSDWKNWRTWEVDIKDIENVTNINLLPSLTPILGPREEES